MTIPVTFAAATILLAALQCPDVDTGVKGNSFEQSWQRCLSILEHYQEQIHSAPHAIRVLRKLKSQITSEFDQG